MNSIYVPLVLHTIYWSGLRPHVHVAVTTGVVFCSRALVMTTGLPRVNGVSVKLRRGNPGDLTNAYNASVLQPEQGPVSKVVTGRECGQQHAKAVRRYICGLQDP